MGTTFLPIALGIRSVGAWEGYSPVSLTEGGTNGTAGYLQSPDAARVHRVSRYSLVRLFQHRYPLQCVCEGLA